MRSLAAYIVTMDDAQSFIYNSNDRNRGGMGYFCDTQDKAKKLQEPFRACHQADSYRDARAFVRKLRR